MKAENLENKGYLQGDSVEHEKYAEEDLLEKILSRENLNRAYKKVKANKGIAEIDGMTVEEALPRLKENGTELLEKIRADKYKPSSVFRKEVPRPDGGKRELGIPTVLDRIIQQTIMQQITPIYEPFFSERSYGGLQTKSKCTANSGESQRARR